MLRTSLTVALAIAACASPAQAGPRDGRDIVSATVSYHALDLAHPAGQLALDQRIARAARRICATGHVHRGAIQAAAEMRCRREAIASARVQRDVAVAAAVRRQRLAGASLARQSQR